MWEGAIEQVLFVGISRDEDIVWREVFKPMNTWKPRWVLGDQDSDFSVFKVNRATKGKKNAEEQGEESSRALFTAEAAVLVLNMAPRFETVGLTVGWVNSGAKPTRMINKLVDLFSEPGDTILDFFQAGRCSNVPSH